MGLAVSRWWCGFFVSVLFSNIAFAAHDPIALHLRNSEKAVAWAITDAQELRVVLRDGKIRDYSLPQLTPLRTAQLSVQANLLFRFPVLAFSQDGTLLYESGLTSSRIARSYSISASRQEITISPLADFPIERNQHSVQAILSPDKRYLAISSSGDESHTKLWNPRNGRLIRELSHSTVPEGQYTPILQFTSSSDRLMRSVTNHGSLLEWKVPSGELTLQRIGEDALTHSVGYFPLASALSFIRLPSDSQISFISSKLPGQERAEFPAAEMPCALYSLIAWFKDGSVGLCHKRHSMNMTSVFDSITGQELFSLYGYVGWPYTPFLSSSGRWFITVENHRDEGDIYLFHPRSLFIHDLEDRFSSLVNDAPEKSLEESFAQLPRANPPIDRRVAIERLVRSRESVALIAARLAPALPSSQLSSTALAPNINLLSSWDFRERQRGHQNIAAIIGRLGSRERYDQIRATLMGSINQDTVDPEKQRRILQLLSQIPQRPTLPVVSTDDERRRYAYFQILARIHTSESRTLLTRLRDESFEGSEIRNFSQWALDQHPRE